MADPWLRQVFQFPNGPGQATDNITGLANQAAKGLGSLPVSGTALPVGDIWIEPISITVGATANGTITQYLITSPDGVHWEGNIDPTSGSNQAAALAAYQASNPAFQPTALIQVSASGTAYSIPGFSVISKKGNVPNYCGVVHLNTTGSAFSATSGSHFARYTLETYL
jgi:hypothetical protein